MGCLAQTFDLYFLFAFNEPQEALEASFCLNTTTVHGG